MSIQTEFPAPYQYVCVVGCVFNAQTIEDMEDHEFRHANNLRNMSVYSEPLIDDENHHHQLLMRIYARRKLIKSKSPAFLAQFRYPIDLADPARPTPTDSNHSQISLEA